MNIDARDSDFEDREGLHQLTIICFIEIEILWPCIGFKLGKLFCAGTTLPYWSTLLALTSLWSGEVYCSKAIKMKFLHDDLLLTSCFRTLSTSTEGLKLLKLLCWLSYFKLVTLLNISLECFNGRLVPNGRCWRVTGMPTVFEVKCLVEVDVHIATS